MREGWKEVEIKSFAEIVGGGTPSTKNEEYWNGDIPWITPNDLSNHTFKYIERGERNITDLGLSKSSAKLHPINTLLLTSRAPIGYLALAKNEVSTNQGFQSIRCDEKKADANYVYYALQVYMDRVKALASGATFPEVSGKKVGKVKLPLPPLQTQKKIASILSGYDDLIENNLKRIKILEEMAQQTYEEWFVRMRFPGYETAGMNDETGLPVGWEKVKLGDVADINKTNLKKGFSGKIKYIDIASVSPNQIGELTEYDFKDAPGRARRVVKNGDIIWSCVRPNRRSHALIINPEENLIASTGFCVISSLDVPFVYLYHALTTDEFVGYLTNLAGGAAYPAVTQNHFEDAEIIIPSKQLLDEFEGIFGKSKYIINNLQDQNQRLREARDILLPRLMMGMVEV